MQSVHPNPKPGTIGYRAEVRLFRQRYAGRRDMREFLPGCDDRYLSHPSTLGEFYGGVRALNRPTRLRELDGVTVPAGHQPLRPDQQALQEVLQNPRVKIAGIRRADLQNGLGPISSGWVSRRLGVIKRVAGTYSLLPDQSGRAIAAAGRLGRALIVPSRTLWDFLILRIK